MEFMIKNECLSAKITSRGGELLSLKNRKGKEYLWQGDEASWTATSPNLFPYIGRLTDGTYTYQGQEYHMRIHGFLMYMDMEPVKQETDCLVLKLESSEETKKQYPFEFIFEIQYKLMGNTLEMLYRINNTDCKCMHFGVGGHPGFQIPIEKDQCFEDYCIDFGVESEIYSVGLSDDCHPTGQDVLYPLREKRCIDLRHDLFARHLFVLKDMPRKLRIRSKKGGPSIEVAYPDMNYLGVWHWPGVEVPYVCVEPWSSLPSAKKVIEDLETQKNLISLDCGKRYENRITISIHEN